MAALRPRPARAVPLPQVGTGGHQHPKAINKSNKSVCHSLRTARRRWPLLPAPAWGEDLEVERVWVMKWWFGVL